MSDKTIRFIDPNYNDLFRLPDGGHISIQYPDGNSAVFKCEYLDDYHLNVGSNCFHICQFAELMQRNGATVMPETESSELQMGWELGRDYLLITMTDTGYNWMTLDYAYKLKDSGQENSGVENITQARNEVMEKLNQSWRRIVPKSFEAISWHVDFRELVNNDMLIETEEHSVFEKHDEREKSAERTKPVKAKKHKEEHAR